MTNTDLAGAVQSGTEADPRISSYSEPTAPPGGSTTPGPELNLPNSGVKLQPFLRAFPRVSYAGVGTNGNVVISWTWPLDAQEGDLAIFAFTNPINGIIPAGWNQVWVSDDGETHVWSHRLTADEPGQVSGGTGVVAAFGHTSATVGVWGNVAKIDHIEGNSTSQLNTATAPAVDVPGGDAAAFIYLPSKNYFTVDGVYGVNWTFPAAFEHTSWANIQVQDLYWPVIADSYPVEDVTLNPVISAQPEFHILATWNVSIVLTGTTVFPYAEVALEERTGADSVDIEQYVHVMAKDMHSPQIPYGYAEGAMKDAGDAVVYSYERWVRLRFSSQFNTVGSFRFFAPSLLDLPEGWSIRCGTATEFRTPVNSSSSIATTPMPTSDPGRDAPNAGGETRLAGTGMQYSDWIVLQASADTAVVGPGPVLGFSTEGTLIPIEFCFVWTET